MPAGVTQRLTWVGSASVKVATQFALAESRIWVLAAVPLQLPDQPEKLEPGPTTAESVTVEPDTKLAVHAVPHVMPAGAEFMVPEPVPVPLTESVNDVGGGGSGGGGALFSVNAAEQSSLAVRTIVALVVVAPWQAPDHPLKVEPARDIAVKVTVELIGNRALQILPQAIPAGVEFTVPLPVPVKVTESLGCVA